MKQQVKMEYELIADRLMGEFGSPEEMQDMITECLCKSIQGMEHFDCTPDELSSAALCYSKLSRHFVIQWAKIKPGSPYKKQINAMIPAMQQLHQSLGTLGISEMLEYLLYAEELSDKEQRQRIAKMRQALVFLNRSFNLVQKEADTNLIQFSHN